MATTSFNPKYRPVRTLTHAELGRVDVYKIRSLNDDACGAQALFLRNNARPNFKREYGIKLFNTMREAFAAYQRQKIAADAGLAPPVRRMVKVMVPPRRYYDNTGRLQFCVDPYEMWGYQTCIAYGIGVIEVPEDYDGVCIPAAIRNALGMDTGVRRMFLALVKLSIAGTQRGNRKMGNVYGRHAPRMCEDLHRDNLGFWRKRPVVIDFGGHLVGEC